MNKVSIKSLLIFKSHIFPNIQKPIRSITDFLMFKNKQLDRIKAKKMFQLLDQDEKKKLQIQRDQNNQDINVQLQKYYRSYIQPFQNCPDYYLLLFQYALKKLELFSTTSQFNQSEDPFFLQKKKVLQLAKTINYSSKNQESLRINIKKPQLSAQQTTSKSSYKLPKQQKMLFSITQNLYPYQKQQIYNRFIQLYKQFLLNHQQISKYLLDYQIVQIRPFIFNSPLQLYQSKNHDKGLKECKNLLIKDVNQRGKANTEFLGLLEQRKKEVEFLQSIYKTQMHKIWHLYRRQYYHMDQYRDFYSLLKSY